MSTILHYLKSFFARHDAPSAILPIDLDPCGADDVDIFDI